MQSQDPVSSVPALCLASLSRFFAAAAALGAGGALPAFPGRTFGPLPLLGQLQMYVVKFA